MWTNIILTMSFLGWTALIWCMAVGYTRMGIEMEEIDRRAELEMILRQNKTYQKCVRYLFAKENGYVQFETNQN